jgi:hypothetical protein
MTTAIGNRKSSGLAKSDPRISDLARRLDRAAQSRDEKVKRADAEYVEAVGRAYESVRPTATEAPAAEEPVTATA